jgi:hypothetical protein
MEKVVELKKVRSEEIAKAVEAYTAMKVASTAQLQNSTSKDAAHELRCAEQKFDYVMNKLTRDEKDVAYESFNEVHFE